MEGMDISAIYEVVFIERIKEDYLKRIEKIDANKADYLQNLLIEIV